MPQLACVQAWEAPPRPFAISQCLSSLPLASTQVTFQSLQAPSSCVHYGPGHKYLASCRVRRCSHRPDSMRCRPRQRRRSSPTAGHTTARRPMSGARVSCCTYPVLRCARGPPQAGLAPLPARVPALPGPWRRLKRGRQGTLRCMSARAEYPFERPGDAGDPQRFQKARATAARRLFPVSHLWWPCSACGP